MDFIYGCSSVFKLKFKLSIFIQILALRYQTWTPTWFWYASYNFGEAIVLLKQRNVHKSQMRAFDFKFSHLASASS